MPRGLRTTGICCALLGISLPLMMMALLSNIHHQVRPPPPTHAPTTTAPTPPPTLFPTRSPTASPTLQQLPTWQGPGPRTVADMRHYWPAHVRGPPPRRLTYVRGFSAEGGDLLTKPIPCTHMAQCEEACARRVPQCRSFAYNALGANPVAEGRGLCWLKSKVLRSAGTRIIGRTTTWMADMQNDVPLQWVRPPQEYRDEEGEEGESEGKLAIVVPSFPRPIPGVRERNMDRVLGTVMRHPQRAWVGVVRPHHHAKPETLPPGVVEIPAVMGSPDMDGMRWQVRLVWHFYLGITQALARCPNATHVLWLEDDVVLPQRWPLPSPDTEDRQCLWALHLPTGVPYVGVGAMALLFPTHAARRMLALFEADLYDKGGSRGTKLAPLDWGIERACRQLGLGGEHGATGWLGVAWHAGADARQSTRPKV